MLCTQRLKALDINLATAKQIPRAEKGREDQRKGKSSYSTTANRERMAGEAECWRVYSTVYTETGWRDYRGGRGSDRERVRVSFKG